MASEGWAVVSSLLDTSWKRNPLLLPYPLLEYLEDLLLVVDRPRRLYLELEVVEFLEEDLLFLHELVE